MKQLNEKVAVVTGAGQGIGKGIALCLAKRGVKVVCTGRREAPIQQTVAEIEEAGGQGLAMTCDSADRARVEEVVKANAAYVPPFGSGATLYIRPLMFATGDVIGVKPADEYQFRILVTPVGPYYKGGVKPVKLVVPEFDRAAPHGTGNIKAGLNYAMSLHPSVLAHAAGYADNLFLDPQTRTYVEETGGANVLFVTKEGKLVVPQSFTDSILPSITRRSLVQVAEDLGMEVEQRPVRFDEIDQFVECGMCGTAAVISPVGEIDNGDKKVVYGMEHVGPVMKKLRETLTGIQSGAIEDKHNWVHKIDVE